MRKQKPLVVLACLAAFVSAPAKAGSVPVFDDGFETGSTCAWAAGTESCPGVHIATPAFAVDENTSTVCYYFRTPNDATLAIRRWTAYFGIKIRHAILYLTYDDEGNPADAGTPGSVAINCPTAVISDPVTAYWTYAAYEAPAPLDMPDDDGSGTPLAMEIGPNQSGFLFLYIAPGSNVSTSASIDGETRPAEPDYTATSTYQTYGLFFSIPSNGMEYQYSNGCNVMPGAQFWRFSTHTHGLGVFAEVSEFGSPLLQTTGFEDSAAMTWGPPDFYEFDFPLGYRCGWINNTGSPVIFGTTMEKENCSTIGYFFPATRPYIYMDSGAPQ